MREHSRVDGLLWEGRVGRVVLAGEDCDWDRGKEFGEELIEVSGGCRIVSGCIVAILFVSRFLDLVMRVDGVDDCGGGYAVASDDEAGDGGGVVLIECIEGFAMARESASESEKDRPETMTTFLPG